MKRIPVLYLIPPVIAALIGVMFFVGLFREGANSLPSTLEGRAAPPLVAQPLPGYPPIPDDVLSQPGVKLVNFWASWCAPCRVEHPNLLALSDLGIRIIGVNYKDKEPNALGFLAELGSPFAALGADPAGRTAIEWGVYGIPETFVIDGDGKVVLRFAGPLTQRAIDATLMPAIEKAEAR